MVPGRCSIGPLLNLNTGIKPEGRRAMATSGHKKFQSPDEVRTFERGKAEILNVRGGVVGAAHPGAGLALVETCETTCQNGVVWMLHIFNTKSLVSCI